MKKINTIEGDLIVRGARFAIIAGRFNDFIVDQLIKGAVDALIAHGAEHGDISLIKVPGAFEIPAVLSQIVSSGNSFDGIVTLGAVIRGSTPHFDYVADNCASGIAQIAMQSQTPISFGVLTVDNLEQAIERAGTKAGNKGADAALATIEMVNLKNQLQK